ncbi:hypothetical protein C5167_003623 [Papaver somniferum]|uniref:Chorismate mutase n=1 Tax=Papaver somniferum TaxID=3469 RepID=A0A4Y7L4R3_PAPSO|nr:chorismate mutase 2-like [Papaver somniferum]RZC79418.1 hypothetical protein C5167_003623 [Papaver somniferum]
MASSPSPPCAEITRYGNSKEEGLLMIDLERVRKSLIRQEDSIVFSLIERAKFPSNSSLYKSSSSSQIPGFDGSLIQYIVKETEILHSKIGRYESPEEHPFFPDGLPLPLIPCPPKSPEFLHGAASSININSTIWKFYLEELLPLFTKQGDDTGSYACTAVCDLSCLQALSRRIHYGKFVAEVKFRDAPEEYGPAIRAQDRDALMKLLTFEDIEEMVKKRVAKKAMIFSQEVNLKEKDADDKQQNCKIDPSLLSRLYGEWVMPLTKLVQVEYLLRRLDK